MDFLRQIIFKNCSNEFDDELGFTSGIEQCMVTPSNFMEEMQLSTQQRLEKVKRAYLKKKSSLTSQCDIIPNIVIFQNFKEGEIQTIPLSVINSSKQPYCLTFLFTNSPYFSITYTELIPDKLAPGMELQCFIHFNPESLKDYAHKMKIITTSKEYTVPIIAIGPRPVLNLPDHIILPKAAIHIGTEKLLLVKNLGQVPGIFVLHTDPPFYIKPASGILKPNESMQVVVQFKSEDEGLSDGTITVKFDTGETLTITAKAKAESANISLSKELVNFNDTYMGLRCQKIIQLQNKSDHIINFSWKKFNSNELDKSEGDKIKESLVSVRDHETKRSTKLETFEVIDKDINDTIYKRIFDDEIVDFDKTEQFLYTDQDFFIIPISGDIYPHHNTDISVVFSPTVPKELSSIAYCKVTGRSDRLALNLRGVGIGPKFSLNIDNVDLNSIYLFDEESFEIVVYNNGDIPGQISFVTKGYDFGNEISCKPLSLYLKPFEHGAFVIILKSNKDGSFVEEIHFLIEESEELIKVIVKGTAIYATLGADKYSLEFGVVTIGKKENGTIVLYNKTSIDIPFECTIDPDGSEPSIILCNDPQMTELPRDPKQYNCLPPAGVVQSGKTLDLELELIANTCDFTEVDLCIEVWRCPKQRLHIYLSHTGALPNLTFTPNEVNIRFCFVNYLCQRLLTIQNTSNYAGYIWLYTDISPGLSVTTDITGTLIEPFGTAEVVLNLICSDLGKQNSELKVLLFGGEETVGCTIECIGQGPVILIIPERLNFGEVQLLQDTMKTVEVYNDSPIPAEFSVQTKKNSPWTVTPTEVYLEPEESRLIEISVFLNDTRKYTGKIFFDVVNRGILECHVTALGVGTSIEVLPSLLPVLDLESQLTQNHIKRKFMVTNRGVRFHKILIAKTTEVKNFQAYDPRNIESIFNVVPFYFVLKPKECIEIVISGLSRKIEFVEEPIYFHAIIEKIEKKQIIISTKVIVNFIEPNFYFSKNELTFRVDHCVTKNVEVLTDIVEVKNLSPITLYTDVTVKSPFILKIQDECIKKSLMEFEENEMKYITVCFEPNYIDKHSYFVKSKIDFKYKGHSKRDFVKLSAEVNYPNIKFFPEAADFGYAVPGTFSCFTVEIRNVSPITVTYTLQWSEEDICFSEVPLVTVEKPILSEEPCSEYSVSSQPTEESEVMTIETIEIDKNEKKGKKGKEGKGEKEKKEAKKGKKEKKGGESKSSKKSDKSKTSAKGKKPVKLLPIEYIFEHYYTEEYIYYPYTQIFEELHDPLIRETLIGLSEPTKDNQQQLREFLYFSIQSNITDDSCFNMIKCMEQEPPEEEPIDSVLNIVPTHGVLEPFESQHIYISFYPKMDTSVKANLLCHIVGGPTEVLPISGTSSDIHFELESSYIDFGRQVFSEISEKKLKIMNKGYVPFTFITTAKEPDEVQSLYILEAGCLTVQPRTGLVDPHSELDLLLRYFPGIGGKFFETFELEIGHLAPITITVSGYGVFPQVYLNLMRPSISEVDTSVSYVAVANLKSDFLTAVEHIRVWVHPEEYFACDLPKSEKRALQRDGWVIVSYNNSYPSIMDIDLSIERVLAYKQIIQQPSILLTKSKSNIGILCPPYFVDFGIVVTNTIAHYTVLILNYGPTKVRVRVARDFQKTKFTAAGFELQFKAISITVGDTIPVYILFSPTTDTYPDRYQEVNQLAYLEVFHGSKIPIEIKAIVTKPFLFTLTDHLLFDEVNCGNSKTMNFTVKNASLVPCFWKARIEHSHKKPKSIFTLKISSGNLESGEEMLLDVNFEPVKQVCYKAILEIEVEHNDEVFILSLSGQGLRPQLKIDKHELNFEPCVPFANHSVQCFSIQNPCDFPIEYFFSDFDKQILDEEKIRYVLCEYYAANKLSIPERLAGCKLPQSFYEFCEEILKQVKREQNMDIDDSKLSRDTSRDISNLSAKSKKQRKTRRILQSIQLEEEKPEETFLDKSCNDLITLIQDFMRLKPIIAEYAFLNPLLEDPVNVAVVDARGPPPKIDPTAMKEGVLFIFYGGPLTDCLYAANKTGRQLNLPVVSLDDMICEALIYNSSLSCIKINVLINNAFELASEPPPPPPLPGLDFNLEEEIIEKVEDDPFKILKEKIDLLVLNKPPKKGGKDSSKGGSKSGRSSKSDKSSKKSKGSKKGKTLFDNSRTLIGLPEDLILELLKQKLLEYKTGLVIESLNNNFIRQPMLTFNSLLHATGNLKYIHCVILHHSLDEYKLEMAEAVEEATLNLEKQTGEMLEHFNSITEEEFDNLPPEFLELYRSVYLAKRKEQTLKRLEALQLKKGGKKKTQKDKKKNKNVNIKDNASSRAKKSTTATKAISATAISAKSSDKSDKSSKKKVKLDPETAKIYKEFEDFSKIYDEILHISEFWDRKACSLTKVYEPKKLSKSAKGKKSPTSKKGKSADKKGKKKEEIIPVPIEILDPIVCVSPIGFPFWVIKKFNVETIPNVIKCHDDFVDACETLQQSLIEVLTPTEETFTVMNKPTKERQQILPEAFKIWSCDQFSEQVLAQYSFQEFDTLKSQLDDTESTQISQLNTVTPLISSHDIEIDKRESDAQETFEGRTVLQPGEIKYYCIRFSTKSVGLYEYTYSIELTNWNAVYEITCKAQCDTPRISMKPKVMFPMVIQDRTVKNEFRRNVFIKSTEIFDLGYKLLCNNETRDERFIQEETNIVIKNISAVSCDISVHIVEPGDVFRTSADYMLVPSYNMENLMLSACPEVLGSSSNILALAIKDNPNVEIVQLQSTGCTFGFEIQNKKIAFERVLLNHHESKIITMVNKSSVPVNWLFINLDAIANHFVVEPEGSFIKPFETIEVTLLYLAPQVENLKDIKLIVEVYPEFGRGKPLLEDVVEINAETVDLIIDCFKNIDFGEIKAKKDYKYDYTFLNRGKYNILYELKDFEDNESTRTQKRVREMFQINPMNGTIVPNKLTTVSIIFNSSKTINIKEMPLVICNLKDHIYKNELSTYYITVTAKSLYSHFDVYPIPDLNFGTMLVGTTSTQKITITNTGKVEFNYTVLCKKTLDELQAKLAKKKGVTIKGGKGNGKSSKASKKSKSSKGASTKTKGSKSTKDTKKSKSSKQSKGSKNTKKEKPIKLGPPITCGPYICKNSKNLIKPKEKSELEIECNMRDVGLKEEMLIVFVSEPAPKDVLGKMLNLTATGCIPKINYEDYDKIFIEHFIVDKYEEFVKPKELGSHCVFARETKSLTFNNTCINTVSTAQIQLYNDSLVDSEVNIKVELPPIFTVKPTKLYIPSYSHGQFTVEFKPVELMDYKARLELQTVMPAGYKTESKTFLIKGEGKVPQIVFKETCFTIDDTELYVIKYNPTLIEKCCTKLISFQNSGDMPCKVLVEINDDTEDVYSLEVQEDTIQYLNCLDTIISKHAHLIKLIPGEIGNFILKYESKVVAENKCLVKIHVINNPYDSKTIQVFGESFVEDVVFEEILTAPYKSDPITSVSEIALTNHYCTSYIIDFGCIYLNTLQKTKFKILNRSISDTFKFIFRSPIPEVVFIPAVGHLKPSAWKNVIVTFLSEIPVNYKTILMDCLVCKITYVEFVDTHMSWDERQQLIIWDDTQWEMTAEDEDIHNSPRKMLEECPEPMYDVVQESVQRIPIIFSVQGDYSMYRCDVNGIKFIDTFMFDKRVATFTVFNPVDINLEIYWDITLDKNCSKLSIIKKENKVSSRAILSAYCGEKRSGRPRPLTGHEKFIGEPCKSIVSIQSSTISDKVSDNNKYQMPFTIKPDYTLIPPKEKSTITIIFHPKDVFEYKAQLKGTVSNLSPKQKDINMEIIAKSLVPCCHFDVKLSDYISSGRRQPKECDDIIDEANTKVVEIYCLGVGIKHDKEINITNPTEDDLTFSWHPIKSYGYSSISLFECQNMRGVISKGKVFSVIFTIYPQSVGIFEALYNFKIEKYDIIMPFLIVANVRESDVRFLSSHLALKPAVLGICVNGFVTLRNNEDVDINYKIKRSSMYSEGRKQCLAVEPRKGVIARNSESKIQISYNPNDIGEEAFTLRCNVDYSRSSILLPVTTKCYEVQLLVISTLFGKKSYLSSEIDNIIPLGDMLPNHCETVTFCIRNEGNIGFYYIWSYSDDVIERRFNVDISPREGYIKTNTEVNTEMNVKALRPALLKNFKIELKVRYGPTYKILLNGIASNTTYKFSFLEYDFGPCFIQTSNICYFYKTLEFVNAGMYPLTLECAFINTDYLTVDFKIGTVLPKSKHTIVICFAPRKIQKYSEEIVFTINLQKIKVNIMGEGIKLDVSVVNITDRDINLGTREVGQFVTKTVKVINKCPITIQAFIDIWDRLPIILNPIPPAAHYLEIPKKEKILEDEKPVKGKDKGKKGKKDKKDSKKGSKKDKASKATKSTKGSKKSKSSKESSKTKGSKKSKDSKKSKVSKKTEIVEEIVEEFESPEEIHRRLVKSMVTITPKTAITIPPNRTAEFTISYVPSQKILPFTEKISVQVLELVQPLCIVEGAVAGPEFHFDRNEISFGVVVLHCVRERKLILFNEGEISSRFHWVCDDRNFSIVPMEGYSTAGLPVTFTIKYHPSQMDIQTKYKAQCILESYDKPLDMMLIGLCADMPPPSGTILFTCPVRTKEKQKVTVTNSTGYNWKLFPSVSGDYYSCTDRLNVKSKSSAVCEIIYEPLRMTKDDDTHTGFIFLKIPDGEAIVYNLVGVAKRPEPIENKVIEIPCKTNYKQVFKVPNWTNYKQEFKVYTEDITPGTAVNLYELKGLEFIEVLGLSEKEYEWHFYAYKECFLDFRIIFMNEVKEYMFYHLLIKVTKSKPLDTINLTTCVRTPIMYQLLLINPLDTLITYKISCNSPYVTFRNLVEVEPHTETKEDIMYYPLLCEDVNVNLDATSLELGTYLYDLHLIATQPVPEETVHFSTIFGQSQVLQIVTKNLSKLKAVFTTKIDDESFYTHPTINLAAGQTVAVPVTFTPFNIGKVHTTLKISSDAAGEYIYPLVGICTDPVPRGPFILYPDRNIIIDFVNPFLVDETFVCNIEPNIFIVESAEEFITSKTTKQIIVSMINETEIPTSPYDVTGKLVIYPKNRSLSTVKWVYYLQGKVMSK